MAQKIIDQLRLGGIQFLPGVANCEDAPPSIDKIAKDAKQFAKDCNKAEIKTHPGPRCD